MILVRPSSRLRIIDVWDRGVPHQERVAIAVDRPCDLGKYILLRCIKKEDGGIWPVGNLASYWFPSEKVDAHSMVFVYTDPGEVTRSEVSDFRIPSIVFHWGSESTLFNHHLWVPAIVRVNRLALMPHQKKVAGPGTK